MLSSEAEASWLAGIVDGEGSINSYFRTAIERQRTGKGSVYGVFLQIANTDDEIVRKVQSVLEARGIRYSATLTHKNDIKPRKPLWHIIVNQNASQYKLLLEIEPYLTGRKRRRASLALQYLKTRLSWGKGNGHQLSEREINLLRDIQML
jgi:hypothetical protein